MNHVWLKAVRRLWLNILYIISATDIQLLTLCILMDFSLDIDALSMGLSIVYLNGSHVEFSLP